MTFAPRGVNGQPIRSASGRLTEDEANLKDGWNGRAAWNATRH
eukprot:CAMPEP_0113706366 /NCGR_PEP_ID=MMETSP0038_2-20120614/27676_1 /TAXON_ID=2898 /ORGANISM="Cryptomonas paramecium" /LENGTH=42 /DNA_ID=CAMNT_0000631533 /DNA_START=407 /DNA_END=535 /DNA_ORIENTATION=- /assembly_acc=CAM_ASM_000170